MVRICRFVNSRMMIRSSCCSFSSFNVFHSSVENVNFNKGVFIFLKCLLQTNSWASFRLKVNSSRSVVESVLKRLHGGGSDSNHCSLRPSSKQAMLPVWLPGGFCVLIIYRSHKKDQMGPSVE